MTIRERYLGAILRTALKIEPPGPRDYIDIQCTVEEPQIITGIRVGNINRPDAQYSRRVSKLEITTKELVGLLRQFGFYRSSGLASNVWLYQDLPIVFIEPVKQP